MNIDRYIIRKPLEGETRFNPVVIAGNEFFEA